MAPKTQIIAHRGASGSAPENTLCAFRLAWQQGADGVELDVHLSRDGEVMVHHDATTKRCAGVDKVIAQTDSIELRRLKLGIGSWQQEYGDQTGCTLPLLSEVLDEAPPATRLLIEIKSGPETATALAQTLTPEHLAQLNINLISFRLDSLLAAQQALPMLPCYPVFSTLDADNVYSFEQWLTLAQRHGFAGLDPDYRDIDAERAAASKAAGLALLTWTVNDTAELTRLARLGVDAVASDWPQRLRLFLHNEVSE